MHNASTDEIMLELIFNQFFGVRIINYKSSRSDEEVGKEHFIDVDLNLKDSKNKIFITIHDFQVYISVGGLSFSDIIY